MCNNRFKTLITLIDMTEEDIDILDELFKEFKYSFAWYKRDPKEGYSFVCYYSDLTKIQNELDRLNATWNEDEDEEEWVGVKYEISDGDHIDIDI